MKESMQAVNQGVPARKLKMVRAWFMAALLVAVSAWTITACAVTRNPDGSFKISFAPDMTITALGLEDAKTQLYDLWQKCLSGSYSRPCTAAEIADIKASYDRVIDKKGALLAHLEENPDLTNEELFQLIQDELSEEEWEALGLTDADDLLALANK
jgi:hypothetical protein